MAKKRHNVLARQRPRRSRLKKFRGVKLHLLLLVCAILVGGVGYGLFLVKGKLTGLFKSQGSSIVWQISIQSSQSGNLTAQISANAEKLVKENLLGGTAQDLRRTARILRETLSLEQAHLIRTSKDHVVVTLKPRVPVMRVEADTRRYVTRDGVVYGNAAAEEEAQLPLLSGILEKRDVTRRPDNTLSVSPEDEKLIREALQLASDAATVALKIEEVNFDKFRGFFVILATDHTEVFLGRAPFKANVRRLKTILQDLLKKGSQAMRIELDYQGKAFIKEKPI